VGDAWQLQRTARGTGLSGAPTGMELQRSTVPDLEENRALDMLQWLSGGAPECPVRHSTEGRNCLPRLSPTTSSYLGAIKRTPRCMEESPKHSLSILRLPHSASAHLIDCVSDLSSVRVVNSLCYVSSSSLGLCVCAADLCVVCVALLALLLCLLCDLYCKGERLQLVKIPRKWEKDYKV
jgi:hypothetical protein